MGTAANGSGTSDRPGDGAALRIAVVYALVAGAWIFGSDILLQSIFSESTIDIITGFQTFKGLLFVFATAAILYTMVRRTMLRIEQSQRALEASEARFRRMVEWSPNGIFVDLDARFVYVNQSLVRLLGASDPGQLIGRSVLDIIHPAYHALVKERRRILCEERRAVPLLEERMRRMDGTYVWVEVAAQPFDYDGKPGSQVIVRDISARKQAESELHQLNETLERRVSQRTAELQQANDDLQTFSYTISHDLRTPLRSISRLAEEQLGDASAGAETKAAENARRIVAAAARLERLVQDLLEYNQLARQEIRPQRVSLVLLLHEVIGQLQRDSEFAQADVAIREPMPWVLVHRPTLSMVLQNLLSNAAKYVAPGVTPAITIRAEEHSDMARIIVEDNGVGMPASRAAGIYQLLEQPHQSSDTGGSGVGLAIVRRGVERMGGRVGVESKPGEGSRFWIELPRDPAGP